MARAALHSLRSGFPLSRSTGILRYELPGGFILLAGLSAHDNERLTRRIAGPNDWWFHVNGVPGSHVVLLVRDGEEPGRPTLLQAAAVAAYHSKARRAGTVAVHCTRARHVRKPRGAELGTVTVGRGDVLKVRPDTSFARRLAAGEEA